MPFFSRVFLPFLLLVYLGVETYLKLQHTSLCGEVGCKLAGELLKFNALYLNYFGLAGVFALMIVGYRSLKSTFFETLFFMLLYAAIAFEATILAYQLIANPEPCIFCLGIFTSLLLIALFSHVKSFAFVITSVFAIFLGLSSVNISKNKAYISAPGLYLIQSETCSHCKKVKKYFSKQGIHYTPISVKEVNPKAFLKFVDISTIPVLVIKERSDITVITGDKKIIAHFEAQRETDITSSESVPLETQSNTLGLPSDFLSAGGNDGCALTITETPSCEDDNTTH
jgi:glutaredoxin